MNRFMSTVIVIGTAHYVDGVCTSEKLYEIIQKINPEVVFCEASPEKLPQYLKRTDVNTPEMNVINRLNQEEKFIEIVPVDVNEDPFDQRLEAMFELIKREMEEYLGATRMLFSETYLKGLPFLNSVDCDKICRDKNSMEKYFININRMKYKGERHQQHHQDPSPSALPLRPTERQGSTVAYRGAHLGLQGQDRVLR